MQHTNRLDLIRDLRERVHRVANGGRETAASVVQGPDALNSLLAGRGFEPGTLVEWSSAGVGHGAMALALSVAGQIRRDGQSLAVLDGAREIYPPALTGLGLPFDRTVVVRPADPATGLWAWEQALRCRAVAVTVGRIEGLNERLFHRLQLAVETGGGLGFLLRLAGTCVPTKAALRLRVSAVSTPLPALRRRLRVERLHGRGEVAASAVELELDHETGHVHQVSALADPAPASCWLRA
jgi:protein ImuA